jgi:hypothetical protein
MQTAMGIAMCTAGGPIACAAYTTMMVAFSTSVAIEMGAQWDQVLKADAIGIAAGAAGGAVGGAIAGSAAAPLAKVLAGAVGGSVAAGLTTLLTGGSLGDIGHNLLVGAAMGAVTAAATLSLQGQNPLSMRSAAEQQGGGDGLSGLRQGHEPNLGNNGPNDPVACGSQVECVDVNSAEGRSWKQRQMDQEAYDFGSRETAGYRNARAATIGEQAEYGAEVVRTGNGGFGNTATRTGQDYFFEPDLSVDPEAVEHTHISPYRSASTGDVQWAERNNVGVYTLTGGGEFLYYDPRTNVQYYLEYLGRIK